MNQISRRSLARWAVEQLGAGQSVRPIAQRLAAVLIDNKVTDQAGFLMDDILWELEHKGILAYAKITSAQSLSKQLETALTNKIKKATRTTNVMLEKSIDKSTIGGVRIETAGRVWDETVAKKLTVLKEVL